MVVSFYVFIMYLFFLHFHGCINYHRRWFLVTIVHATRFIYFLVLAAFGFIVDAKENYHRQLTRRELTQVFGVQNHNEGRIMANHFIAIAIW